VLGARDRHGLPQGDDCLAEALQLGVRRRILAG
jgi:hypothetical protein